MVTSRGIAALAKIKQLNQDEVMVAGWIESERGRSVLGALLLAYYTTQTAARALSAWSLQGTRVDQLEDLKARLRPVATD